jgi:DNA-binding CsgD family transcriptional regulator
MDPPAADGWGTLVERDAERAVVDRVLGDCERGHGRVVLLYGPAGVGRSSLLHASVLEAESRGIAVVQATGSELERAYAFGVCRQLLEAHIAQLTHAQRRSLLSRAGRAAESALGIGESEVPRADATFEQIQAVYRLITGLAAARPLLVAVDDMQWCDRPSLDLLCFLGHRATRLPVVIIAGWRRGEPGVRAGRLQALAAKPGTVFLTLGELSEAGVAAVVRRETGEDPAPETVGVIHAQTGGQPFLVSELAAGVRLRRLSTGVESRTAIEAITPESVRRNTIARLGRHPAAIQRFAHAAAVLGEGPSARAAELAGIDSDRAREAASALARAGILRDDATTGYAQPLLRSAVYDTLSLLERAELHHHAAILLLGSGSWSHPSDDDRVVAHLLRSEPSGDHRFGELLQRAGMRARDAGLPADARRILDRALGELDDGPARCAALFRLAELELDAGAVSSASSHAAEALSLASTPFERAVAGAICAQTVAVATGLAAATELLEAEALFLSRSAPDLALVQAAGVTLRACAAAPPLLETETIARFEQLRGDTVPEQAMLAVCASDMALSGAASALRVADVCARVFADSEAKSEVRLISQTSDYLAARAALLADAHDIAARFLARGPRETAVTGLDEPAVSDTAICAQLAHWRGDLAEADLEARRALGSLDGLAPTLLNRRIRSDMLTVLAVTALEGSRQLEAEDALAQLAQADGGHGLALAALRIALALADPPSAVAAACAAEANEEEVGVAVAGLSWRPWAALAHHAAGDSARARSIATVHLDQARAWGGATVLGRALTVQGIVAAANERVGHLVEAVAVLESTPAKLELARATIELGAALRRARRPREARERLTHGADLANRCGAEALAARARAELVSAGARPRRAAFSGVSSLTLSELRVARLAASGMTNREIARELIVSPKTVSGQLTAVYRKLDVHDRLALALALEGAADAELSVDHGPDPPG